MMTPYNLRAPDVLKRELDELKFAIEQDDPQLDYIAFRLSEIEEMIAAHEHTARVRLLEQNGATLQ